MNGSTPAADGRQNGVTIGIPVYNEQDRIERAIHCAAPQCERLVVADNASTDGTESICRRLELIYPHLEYVRHTHNIGALENWHFLLSVTESPYFMTLGSHDFIEDNFIETLRGVLESDPSVMLAAGSLCYEYESPEDSGPTTDGNFNTWAAGAQEDPAKRLRSLLFDEVRLPWAMYGVFRTQAYKECFTRDIPPYGVDTIFLAKIIRRGKIIVTNDTHYHAWIRARKDVSSTYLERLLGSKARNRVRKRMRNAMRVAMFDLLLDSESPATFSGRQMLRQEAMTRFGTFKLDGIDPWFFLLYVPVKLARKWKRLRRLIAG